MQSMFTNLNGLFLFSMGNYGKFKHTEIITGNCIFSFNGITDKIKLTDPLKYY